MKWRSQTRWFFYQLKESPTSCRIQRKTRRATSSFSSVFFCLTLAPSDSPTRSQHHGNYVHLIIYLEVLVDFCINNADHHEWKDELKNSAENSVPAQKVYSWLTLVILALPESVVDLHSLGLQESPILRTNMRTKEGKFVFTSKQTLMLLICCLYPSGRL